MSYSTFATTAENQSSIVSKSNILTNETGNSMAKKSIQNMSLITLSVATDRIKYVEGQSIRIFGTGYNEKGHPVELPITIKVRDVYFNKTTKQHLPGKTMYGAILVPQNGTYNTIIDKGLPVGSTGKYSIISVISFPTADAYDIKSINTITEISVENLFRTTAFKILYIGGGIGIGGIITVVVLRMYSANKTTGEQQRIKESPLSPIYEMFQFIFITVLAFSPIAAFAYTDVELFPNSPVGMIIEPSENGTQHTDEWKINIGGNSSDKYKSGIQVPVAIFIFGVAGGYMRYLFSQADKVTMIRKRIKKRVKQEDLLGTPVEIFYGVLQDVTFLFLSPLLAIAVWLVLLQGGTTGVFTLTAVSFVIGLVTQEVGKSLVAFAKRMLQAFDMSIGEPGSDVRDENLDDNAENNNKSETKLEKNEESETGSTTQNNK